MPLQTCINVGSYPLWVSVVIYTQDKECKDVFASDKYFLSSWKALNIEMIPKALFTSSLTIEMKAQAAPPFGVASLSTLVVRTNDPGAMDRNSPGGLRMLYSVEDQEPNPDAGSTDRSASSVKCFIGTDLFKSFFSLDDLRIIILDPISTSTLSDQSSKVNKFIDVGNDGNVDGRSSSFKTVQEKKAIDLGQHSSLTSVRSDSPDSLGDKNAERSVDEYYDEGLNDEDDDDDNGSVEKSFEGTAPHNGTESQVDARTAGVDSDSFGSFGSLNGSEIQDDAPSTPAETNVFRQNYGRLQQVNEYLLYLNWFSLLILVHVFEVLLYHCVFTGIARILALQKKHFSERCEFLFGRYPRCSVREDAGREIRTCNDY